jgi:hemoglobin
MGSQQDVRSRTAPTRNDVRSFLLLKISSGQRVSQSIEPMGQTFFEQLGGEAELRMIIGTFIDRVFDDRMIGFFFRNSNKQRIKDMEYQLTAQLLGADVEYQGRPLDQVHAKHPIMGGHFARRQQILKETLDFYRVPEPIKQAWLAHTDALRPLITSQKDSECDPNALG